MDIRWAVAAGGTLVTPRGFEFDLSRLEDGMTLRDVMDCVRDAIQDEFDEQVTFVFLNYDEVLKELREKGFRGDDW